MTWHGLVRSDNKIAVERNLALRKVNTNVAVALTKSTINRGICFDDNDDFILKK